MERVIQVRIQAVEGVSAIAILRRSLLKLREQNESIKLKIQVC